MAEAGRPTDLTESLFREIKKSIIDGNDLRTTAKVCEIPESTLYTWHSDNYLNIRDKVEGWKRDRLIKLAEQNIDAIMCLGVNDKDTVKVVQDTSKFVLETLKKEQYSKRTEQTGADGKDLIPSPIMKLSDLLGDNSDTTNSTAQ